MITRKMYGRRITMRIERSMEREVLVEWNEGREGQMIMGWLLDHLSVSDFCVALASCIPLSLPHRILVC
jgi:hypothetical protein